MPRISRLAALLTVLLGLSATPALASTVNNGNDPDGNLTVVPTAGGEANTLTIAYVEGTATVPPGYRVHDDTTDVTIGATCSGCTQTDAKTVFVPADGVLDVQTGDLDSSVLITGQNLLLSVSGQNTIAGGAGNDTLT